MSNQGKRVAYVVKVPNLRENQNDFQLFVRDVTDTAESGERLLVSGKNISHIQWIDDDNRIALLISVNGITQIAIVNASTGRREETIAAGRTIDSFSMDASGSTVAYSVPDSADPSSDMPAATPEQIARGYRVRYLDATTGGFQPRSLYIRHRSAQGVWSQPQLVSIENPFTHRKSTHLEYLRNLSMSPDGKRLFLTFMADGIPKDWEKNPWIRTVAGGLRRLETMILYDLREGRATLAFKSVNCYSRPHWSSDSRSFYLDAHSPVGSVWAAEDIRANRVSARDVNLFEVNVVSGAVTEVFQYVPPLSYHDGPLFLMQDGDVILQTAKTTVVRLHRFHDSWMPVARIDLPRRQEDWFQSIVSNGSAILGVHEAVTSPENLFFYAPGDGGIRLLTDLNPQLEHLLFAPVRRVHWTTGEGLHVDGLLFLPADYVRGKRYPLVIQTKGDSGWFTCDSGANHDPSFAPQPIAGAGMMYLARSFPDDWNYQKEVDMRTPGYPGGIGEAIQEMDIWDSAVDTLVKRGLVNPSKVGIIGFSRTGWEVEFDLAHARTRYAAATAADNVEYSLSEYWLVPWAAPDDERMYGGPPYGSTLKNWEKYSISFNLAKIHTPLLMEEMGYGIHDDRRYSIPISLAVCYEIEKGLMRLGKPVEMYYYPDEDHQPDHPQARMASLTRNLDWYRFWLQGYEDDNPAKKQQYERWRKLRKLQEEDSKSSSRVSVQGF